MVEIAKAMPSDEHPGACEPEVKKLGRNRLFLEATPIRSMRNGNTACCLSATLTEENHAQDETNEPANQ